MTSGRSETEAAPRRIVVNVVQMSETETENAVSAVEMNMEMTVMPTTVGMRSETKAAPRGIVVNVVQVSETETENMVSALERTMGMTVMPTTVGMTET